MNPRLILCGLFLVCSLPLAANPDGHLAAFNQLKAAYEADLESRQRDLASQQRDLLNRFIVSLVRLEQTFRDDGDLDGLMQVRELRETLLETPMVPPIDPQFPPSLQEAIRELHRNRDAAADRTQEEFNRINRRFADDLEPVMRALTREGDFDSARQILNIRREIAAELGQPEEVAAPAQLDPRQLRTSTDANVFPFSLEPARVAQIHGLTPRRTQIPFRPEIDGRVEILPNGFRFSGGQMILPPHAMEAFRFQASQQHMFTLEFGFRTIHGSQGHRGHNLWTALFLWGNSFSDANLILMQEHRNLVLYLRTATPPPNGPMHRIDLGRIDSGRMEHFVVTYRSGEVTIFKDGQEAQKIRNTVTGNLGNWEPFPMSLGRLPPPHPDAVVRPWYGLLVNLYFRATHETNRGVAAHYNRFATIVTTP